MFGHKFEERHGPWKGGFKLQSFESMASYPDLTEDYHRQMNNNWSPVSADEWMWDPYGNRLQPWGWNFGEQNPGWISGGVGQPFGPSGSTLDVRGYTREGQPIFVNDAPERGAREDEMLIAVGTSADGRPIYQTQNGDMLVLPKGQQPGGATDFGEGPVPEAPPERPGTGPGYETEEPLGPGDTWTVEGTGDMPVEPPVIPWQGPDVHPDFPQPGGPPARPWIPPEGFGQGGGGGGQNVYEPGYGWSVTGWDPGPPPELPFEPPATHPDFPQPEGPGDYLYPFEVEHIRQDTLAPTIWFPPETPTWPPQQGPVVSTRPPQQPPAEEPRGPGFNLNYTPYPTIPQVNPQGPTFNWNPPVQPPKTPQGPTFNWNPTTPPKTQGPTIGWNPPTTQPPFSFNFGPPSGGGGGQQPPSKGLGDAAALLAVAPGAPPPGPFAQAVGGQEVKSVFGDKNREAEERRRKQAQIMALGQYLKGF